MAPQSVRALLPRRHVRRLRLRAVRHGAAAGGPRVRAQSGASRPARNGGTRRRVPRRAVLGHDLGLHRPPHGVRFHNRHLLAVHWPCRRIVERAVARRVPLPLELRSRRRSAGRADADLGIQPGPNSRAHDRLDGGIVPGGPGLAAIVALLIMPTWGWRAVFVAGVVPAVLLFFVRIYMPESVRYLITRG